MNLGHGVEWCKFNQNHLALTNKLIRLNAHQLGESAFGSKTVSGKKSVWRAANRVNGGMSIQSLDSKQCLELAHKGTQRSKGSPQEPGVPLKTRIKNCKIQKCGLSFLSTHCHKAPGHTAVGYRGKDSEIQ